VDKNLAAKVRTKFESLRRQALPEFQPDLDADLPPGFRQYKYSRPDGTHFFVVLELNPKADAFSVEVGWSLDGKYPSRILTFLPSDTPKNGSLRFRLRTLDRAFRNGDNGWRLTGSDLDLEAAIGDAFRWLVERYRPYVKSVVSRL